MKKAILTISLFSLVMILTSFTTPETSNNDVNITNSAASQDTGDNLKVDIRGAQSVGGNMKVDIRGSQCTGGNMKVDIRGSQCTGGNMKVD
ncbi:3-oxoacyl-ACP reductase [Flavobacterium sp. W22_SRS_FP1]|uniref:3-oxoacyl-ACP reductase n=1 Tax=Flavobacterium sp. W22_SRS_FP1 TaxID=3240276 RepID=UPI003F9320F1